MCVADLHGVAQIILNESTVDDAALAWFGELGYAVGHGPRMAPGEPGAERDSFSEALQVGDEPVTLNSALESLISQTCCE